MLSLCSSAPSRCDAGHQEGNRNMAKPDASIQTSGVGLGTPHRSKPTAHPMCATPRDSAYSTPPHAIPFRRWTRNMVIYGQALLNLHPPSKSKRSGMCLSTRYDDHPRQLPSHPLSSNFPTLAPLHQLPREGRFKFNMTVTRSSSSMLPTLKSSFLLWIPSSLRSFCKQLTLFVACVIHDVASFFTLLCVSHIPFDFDSLYMCCAHPKTGFFSTCPCRYTLSD